MSVCLFVSASAWSNSALTGRILIKFDIWLFFENLARKFKFHYNRTRITGTLHENQYKFLIISSSFLLRMRNFSDRIGREIQNTHFMFGKFLFPEIVPFMRKVDMKKIL